MPSGIVAAEWTDRPGTVDDLLMDAADRKFPATVRMIRDWVSLGLLDHPERRGRGAAHGSDKAVWPWTQRNLFRLLIDKRPQVKGVMPLCNIPVAIWLWWGEPYVRTAQAQRVLATWAGKVGSISWPTARERARELADFLDDLDASRYQRERLIDALAKTARARRIHQDLHDALHEVFDPAGEGRSYGSTRFPLTEEHLLELIEYRIKGLERAAGPAPLDELERARLLYRDGIRSYAAERKQLLATPIRPQDNTMWDEPTWEHLVNHACYHVSVTLGGFVRHGT